MTADLIVDPYSGPRGWSEGLRTLGLTDIGIELDDSACRTAVAAGHRTIRADVAQYPLDHLAGRVDGAILSPPCQAFSTAGTGEGRDAIPELAAAIHRGDWRWSHTDDRVRHVLEVGRWTETLHPTWVACEQVPPVLPLWQAYADRWRALYGWSVWCGVLNAADYGVPQTRRRAFLIARTDGRPVAPPAPTHTEGGALTMFGELKPWISMADALGWGYDDRGSPTVTGGGGKTGGAEPFGHAARTALAGFVLDRRQNSRGGYQGEPGCRPVPTDEPAPALDSQVGGKWVLRERQAHGAERAIDEPAMTISASADNGNYRWVYERPAPTIVTTRRSSEGIIAGRQLPPGESRAVGGWGYERPATTIVGDGRAFGPHAGSAGEPQSSNAIRLTIRDALILQGFPPDYPVQGTRTKQFEQIGNACPPPLSAHVISAVSGVPFLTEKAA